MGPIRKLFSVHPDKIKQKAKKESQFKKNKSSVEACVKNTMAKKLISEIKKARYLDKMILNAINNLTDKKPENHFFFDDEVLNDLVDRFSANQSEKN